MRKNLLLFITFLVVCISAKAQTTLQIFDEVLFYDGYAALVSEPVPDGVIRHRNDLYATKLSDEQLALIGTSLTMNVTIKASCDNYDRIGNVNLAFVPKGSITYDPTTVPRIEIGRFITPFMDKNKVPDTVPYTYNIDNVAQLLRESSLTTTYDIWAELEVFGVPYAANTEIDGCEGRNDVFFGSMQLVTNSPAPAENANILTPLYFKADFNNYTEGATDTIGKTTRTINFDVEENLSDAVLFLITSNHGANEGGEEYNRRNHYVYFDGENVLTYKPGRTTCEPFRVYNTQPNGIYGWSPRTDFQWQSFSNWCPGDVIDTRTIHLGALTAGSHSFRIEVPDAVFVDGQGYIPLSLYLHGRTSGEVTGLNQVALKEHHVKLFPNPANNYLSIETDGKVKSAAVYDVLGKKVMTGNIESLNISSLQSGLYLLKILFEDNQVVDRKFVKQ